MSSGKITREQCVANLFSDCPEILAEESLAEESLHVANSLLSGLSPLSKKIDSYVRNDFLSLLPTETNRVNPLTSWTRLITWVKENGSAIGEELKKVSVLFMAGPFGAELSLEVRFLVHNDENKTIKHFRPSSPDWKMMKLPGKKTVSQEGIKIPKPLLEGMGATEIEFQLEPYANSKVLSNACFRFAWPSEQET